jgi:hypothetical protein
MPRRPTDPSKTIITTVAGDKTSLDAARLENLKKAREKALELRLRRQSQQQQHQQQQSAQQATPASRKRVKPVPAPPVPRERQLVDTQDMEEDETSQHTTANIPDGGPGDFAHSQGTGSGKSGGETRVSVDVARPDGQEEPGQPETRVPVATGAPSGGAGSSVNPTTVSMQETPRTPASNVTDLPEEGELDPSPGPPTVMARGRSKNNKRKPTTVTRIDPSARRVRAPKPSVVRKLDFDRIHMPVGGGAFYRNHHSGHFTFTR